MKVVYVHCGSLYFLLVVPAVKLFFTFWGINLRSLVEIFPTKTVKCPDSKALWHRTLLCRYCLRGPEEAGYRRRRSCRGERHTERGY